MWLKVFLLLAYILLLFILSRLLEALSWYENGYSGMFSRQLLDPMALSVAKLRALLEQRGVSYEAVVEKSELTSLVESSGHVSVEEVVTAQTDGEVPTETNFTCGTHFIEQVEDAKDSVWLVQVLRHSHQLSNVGDMRWKALRKKVNKFGVRTGLLDCSLDPHYCYQKGWHSPILLLALPSEFEKKANIAMYNYSGPVHETVVMRWMRDKLGERVVKIKEPMLFQRRWQNFTTNPLEPEIRVVLFTATDTPPLFYSALTVKFPGRVKFGMVSLSSETKRLTWRHALGNKALPSYMVFSSERNYIYGSKIGEQFSFTGMERFLRFLYPCLNDIFIISFFVANVISLFEFFVSNCSIIRRITKCVWCIVKYNIIVIMLWLPIIGLFQMPLLDKVPLLALKFERIFSTSSLGTILRGDFSFFQNHPVYIYLSFLFYLVSVTYLCQKYRQEEVEEGEGWFTFGPPAHLVHLRPNNLLEPIGLSRYDFLSRLDVFGSRQSLWLQPSIPTDYIQHLQTWRFCPRPLADKAAENVRNVEKAMELGAATVLKESNQTMSEEGLTQQVSPKSSEKNCKSSDVSGRSSRSHKGSGKCQDCEKLHSQNPIQASTHQTVVSERNRKQEGKAQTQATAVSPDTGQCSHLSRSGSTLPLCQACQSHCPHPISCESSSTSTLSQLNEHFSVSEESLSSAQISASDTSLPNDPSLRNVASTVSESDTVKLPQHEDAMSGASVRSSHPTSSPMGFPAGYIEHHQCVICLEEYAPLVMLCGLPCGHVFHETCIITWLNQEKHFCPMCRWPSYRIPTGSLEGQFLQR